MAPVANVTNAAQPLIPSGTCVSHITADMADVVSSILAKLVLNSRQSSGTQGKESSTNLSADPSMWILRNAMEVSGENPENVYRGALLSVFRAYVQEGV